MSKSLTIHLTDEQYEALQAAAARAQQTPEELIAATVAARYGSEANGTVPQTQEQEAMERLLARLSERGLLVDPKTLPPYPGVEELPARGSSERAQLEEEIAAELSEALQQSGLSILDLIERQ